MSKKKILVGMSGGVDSNIAVKSLIDSGYDVVGATLVMSDDADAEKAKKAAEKLGLEHFSLDCRELFEKHVIDNFISEYLRARTPNPCVVCNRVVKFRVLCDFAREIGADHVSTGHYVGIKNENGRYYISKGADERKDQSYVLWNLSQDELEMLYFPLELSEKSNDMRDAEVLGLVPADYSESQDICFIPSNDHVSFIEKRAGKSVCGDFIDDDGHVVGEHKGIINYTIGQRKGLGLSMGYHVFVSEIDAVANTVRVSTEDKLFKTELTCSDLNFQKLAPGDYDELHLSVKIRYAAKPTPATVSVKNGVATVVFDNSVRAATAGQSAVFYDGDDVMFGGFIDKSH